MSTTPNPAATAPVPRQLTQGEIQRWINDAWVDMNVRLSPGKLNTSCANRVQVHARQNFLSLLDEARSLVFTNYKEAVRLIADAYYRSVIALRFEPNALEWIVEHPSVTKRRELELENRGLEVQTPSDIPDREEKEKKFAEQVAADKAHAEAVKNIEPLIQSIYFTNMRGADHRKIEELQSELREYVAKNLGKTNGVKVLGYVHAKIAWAYHDDEKQRQKWNNR